MTVILTARRNGGLVWTGYLHEGPMLVRLRQRGVDCVWKWIDDSYPHRDGWFTWAGLHIIWRLEP